MNKTAELSIWSDTDLLECVSIIPEAPNVATFVFRAASGGLFNHNPGQFLTLEIPHPDGVVHRTYTISSSPSRPRSISITAKAQADSIGTRWMLDNLQPGMRLKAIGPGGSFSYIDHPGPKYLFISAGSGITPMMSMTTSMWDSGEALDIVFVNCARKPSEILFRDRLEHMASRTPGLKLRFIVEEEDPYQPWTGFQGRFNQLMLGLVAPDYQDRTVFCCGPEPFMKSVREALAGFGFDMAQYHQESFSAPEPTAQPPVPDTHDSSSTGAVRVTFAASDVTVDSDGTETILSAARGAGLNIPSGCTFGVCGTCKTKKLSGEVHMVHNGGISQDDIDDDYILACCSTPLGAVVVDV
ncbi:hybrid-cluster NAD(P)-dependent oxidoreductase [Cognatishimia sp. SS12]|uniref:hybrid-cluster NAD(P)-dependent oxidoreductase n=1 Tax=Cognatishimia sp. SS12 TaxID=2979465 RepID=UPI00232AB856|nr:hybrid-cluster NAD(P)-dependent oxidoreductase [Cognatishimia sp. SS12]MDC0739293.1 hybrid-cluster NAD(P)-dependent oxidoreductase [Cognatishimia sp. SS12]